MKIATLSTAFCAAFFVAPVQGFAETQHSFSKSPLILVKDTAKAPTFAPEDFPWDLPEGRTENVFVPLGEAELSMPWMDVTKDGEDLVTIVAPEMMITKHAGYESDGGAIFKDAELQIRRLGDAMAASGFAKGLTIGDGEENEAQIQLDDFEFALTANGYELTLQAIEDDAESGSDQMIEAMQSLNIALDYSIKSSHMVVKNLDDGSPASEVMLSSGQSESGVRFGDGRLDVSATTNDNSFSTKGPLPVEGEIGLLAYGFSMPVEASKAPQPMTFGIEISDVTASDEIWDMADPREIFPRLFKQAKLNVAMNVILRESMFDNARQGPGSETLEPVDVTLTALELNGLGLDVSATGNMEIDGELPTSISAFLSVAGLSEFMANAVKAGFVPQAQAVMGEGIALQFAKEEDDGSLTFDVKTNDGMVTINGNRVAPLPQ